MADSVKRITIRLTCALLWWAALPGTVSAQEVRGEPYRNPDTGYVVWVEDDAGLLTEEERVALEIQMRKITDFGNVAFKSLSDNRLSTAAYADMYYSTLFGGQSGMVFLIDMSNRMVYVYSEGAVYRTIREDEAETITDNVYAYAGRGEYHACATKVFEQAYDLLQGRRVARPMKYICNALLALTMALMINYALVNFLSKARRTGDKEILDHTLKYFSNTDPTVCYQYQTRVYDPVKSRRGGGGGGGGGRGGGGGGHRF